MSEKVSFCPACQGMRPGIHGKDHGKEEPRQTHDLGSSSGRTSGFGPENEGSIPSPRTKFDRTAYQRELMRERRAAKKAVKAMLEASVAELEKAK